MTEGSRPLITLGVQAGDPQADAAVAPHYKALRALLASHCSKSYGVAINEYAPVLRIDGAIWHLDKRGYGNVRISKKAKSATFDVFMPIDAWQGKDAATMRRSIASDLAEGFKAVIQRTTKDRLDVNGAQLLADVDAALKDFLSE